MVKSDTEPGKTYQLNLGRLTCTCEDFESRRALLPCNDIRRVCKHLGRALEAADALTHYDEICQALIRRQKAAHRRLIKHGVNAERFVVLPDGTDDIVLALSSESTWVDVVTRRGVRDRVKKYKRYGYDVDERRWSYSSAPFRDGDIRAAIHAWFRR